MSCFPCIPYPELYEVHQWKPAVTNQYKPRSTQIQSWSGKLGSLTRRFAKSSSDFQDSKGRCDRINTGAEDRSRQNIFPFATSLFSLVRKFPRSSSKTAQLVHDVDTDLEKLLGPNFQPLLGTDEIVGITSSQKKL
ncbi:hypothetical protein K3495_g199 [Podosphaera aphanis]|nr:hypothetical protein K3495_g199 [Podosphaera aphanis]